MNTFKKLPKKAKVLLVSAVGFIVITVFSVLPYDNMNNLFTNKNKQNVNDSLDADSNGSKDDLDDLDLSIQDKPDEELDEPMDDESLQSLTENSMVYCIINSTPLFSSANDMGSLHIFNPPESIYYSQVVIKTKDDDTELYSSPYIAPNEHIEYDYLSNKNIEKGVHDANAYFNYYYKVSEEFIYVGTMSVDIQVTIN